MIRAYLEYADGLKTIRDFLNWEDAKDFIFLQGDHLVDYKLVDVSKC